MAITITSKPTTHTPAYNNQTFDITSGNTAQANFVYSCTVTISATNTTASSGPITDEIAPRPDNSRGYFNPQKTIESYCHNEFFPTITDFQFSLDGAILEITYSIQEKYGATPTLQGTPSTGSYYVWNASYSAHDFSQFTYSVGTLAKDLTLAPSLTDTIQFDQKYLMKSWHIGFSSNTLRYFNVYCFDETGTNIQTVSFENQYYTLSSYKRSYITFNCSPWGINNYSGSVSYAMVGGDYIPSNTVTYLIAFATAPAPGLSVSTSNTYTVNIDTCGSKYDRYVVHFLNTLGNYDSFTFDLVSRKNLKKKSSDYKKLTFNRTINPPGYYIYDKDLVNYSTVVTNSITLNSDWITDAEAIWLKDLITSPDVYLEDSSNVLYSVKITNDSYETKTKDNDKLFNITLELEYTLEDIRQRG